MANILREQQERREAVQKRGFTLTGPGHGAPQREKATLLQRLNERLTRYSKPVATIDGRRKPPPERDRQAAGREIGD
jgi:hypothetical protein